MEKEINIKVFRKNLSDDEGKLKDYRITVDEHTTVLSALQIIYRDIDQSLAFHNYACYRKVCGLCTYCINGKNKLACKTLVKEGMVIKPPKGKEVIKDLVTKVSSKYKDIQ